MNEVKWPEGKSCAFAMSVDDIHPGKSTDTYEAGGDLEKGALGHLSQLINRNPFLRITLFVTPDWREMSPYPSSLMRFIPGLRDKVYLTPILPKGTMALDRHPDFVSYLQSQPGFEIAHHGLHHVHVGINIPTEFQKQSHNEIVEILSAAKTIFTKSGLNVKAGLQPPAWNMPNELVEACKSVELKWINGARDIITEPKIGSTTNMSGPKGLPLILPQRLPNGVLHFTSNFQATSQIDRAFRILESGGLLAVKAHIIKKSKYHYALDGVDALYMNYLDALISIVKDRYGDSVWWTSFDEIEKYLAERSATNAV